MIWKFRQIRWVPLLATILVFFIIVSAFIGLTATNNIVSNADAGTWGQGISLADKTPPQCAGLGLTDVLVVTSSGFFSPFTGTNANELILGTTGRDYVDGGGGNDCILGGGGDDGACIFFGFWCSGLEGGANDDVIIGGPHTTDGDICVGNGGTDTFYQCEDITQ